MMMSLLEMDAMHEGIERGMAALIGFCQEFHQTREETREQLMKRFHLNLNEADIYMEKYWED